MNAQVADITKWQPAASEKFDYVVASEILEHLALPENVIASLADHARFFVLSVPNSAFYKYRITLFFGGRFLKQWMSHPSEHLRFWSHADFLDWLEASDLRVTESKASNGLNVGPLKLYKLWPNLFGHQICYFAQTGEK